MENDLSNQTEVLVQNLLCNKLNEADRGLLQTWLTSRLTIERCGWKRKMQDALQMLEVERKASIESNSLLVKLYDEMLKVLPSEVTKPSSQAFFTAGITNDPLEERVENLKGFKMKEVERVWRWLLKEVSKDIANVKDDKANAEMRGAKEMRGARERGVKERGDRGCCCRVLEEENVRLKSYLDNLSKNYQDLLFRHSCLTQTPSINASKTPPLSTNSTIITSTTSQQPTIPTPHPVSSNEPSSSTTDTSSSSNTDSRKHCSTHTSPNTHTPPFQQTNSADQLINNAERKGSGERRVKLMHYGTSMDLTNSSRPLSYHSLDIHKLDHLKSKAPSTHPTTSSNLPCSPFYPPKNHNDSDSDSSAYDPHSTLQLNASYHTSDQTKTGLGERNGENPLEGATETRTKRTIVKVETQKADEDRGADRLQESQSRKDSDRLMLPEHGSTMRRNERSPSMTKSKGKIDSNKVDKSKCKKKTKSEKKRTSNVPSNSTAAMNNSSNVNTNFKKSTKTAN